MTENVEEPNGQSQQTVRLNIHEQALLAQFHPSVIFEFCLLIPNIGPKVVDSNVKGDFRALKVPLSDKGPFQTNTSKKNDQNN